MCGIAGVVLPENNKSKNARNVLLDILARQEYRGYDSAGVAVVEDKQVRRAAVKGRVENLKSKIKKQNARDAKTGIAHTRWATHGTPSEKNAHPICAAENKTAIVHNGIIENHAKLRAELEARGVTFRTGTDSEVIAHLFAARASGGGDMLTAMRAATKRLRGAFAVAAVCAGRSGIACARQGSPLLIGEGGGVFYVSSDAPALAAKAARVLYLEDGDCALIKEGEVKVADAEGKSAKRKWQRISASAQEANRGGHKHFMKKEIAEQPQAAAAAMERFARGDTLPLSEFGKGAAEMLRACRSVNIVACGTSYHAAMIARHWIETLAQTPCRAEIASEYRYRDDPQARGGLTIAVSQSGETADTLAAAAAAQNNGAKLMAVVNETQSTLAHNARFVLPMRAGLEIGVASTKAFTAQLTALFLLALALAKAKKTLPRADEHKMLASLRRLPALLRKSLRAEDEMRRWARGIANARGVLFVGRRAHYPLALEGALKLKEISYLHAEGCAAGELKHGTLALVDDKMPVVALTSGGALSSKTESNIAEIAARGGKLHILAGGALSPNMPGKVAHIPDDGGEYLSPLVLAPPLQLLAYHTALIKGADIDKPRNLAKSVTVE